MQSNLKQNDFWGEKTAKSREYFEKAKSCLVNGVASSLHKSPTENYPIYIERGKGSKIYDVDGNEYIDYMGGYGPMILGYCPPVLNQEVIDQIGRGSIFAAPDKILNEVSEKLVDIIPCAELVSYTASGTEANMLNFRLARAFTGKDKIVKFEGHYHGWSDEELISVRPDSLQHLGPRNKPWKTIGSAGQREKAADDIIVLPWNDLELVEKVIERQGHEIAAIITEPIMGNCEPIFPKPGYLQGLRDLTAKNDIVLIFDEVITGFRLSIGGAQEYYGVTPDTCSFGKAVAGGYPLAGVAGKKEIMDSGVHPVGTFNGNPICIAACKATIGELENPSIYEHMANLTRSVVDGIAAIAKSNDICLFCDAVGSIWQLAFGIQQKMNDYRDNFMVNKVAYQKFRKGGLERGIRFHPSRGRQYTSAAHTAEDVEKTLLVVDELLCEMRRDRSAYGL